MATASKNYSSKATAKAALKRTFGAGTYSNNGLNASAKFIDGKIEQEDGYFKVVLSSTYWVESSLERALEVGIDKI